ncbi:MAG: MurR/RpiR family transcriptional regulator [Clostridiales bacterium]|nr:MurR/RpiR family transcriptional regulator [Clostridiales bacterium]
MESIIELISDQMPRMSKGHKAIASYIIESYDKAAYMTAAKLGEETGVSESTVVRFTTELGFDGYPHFQASLKEELKSKLTSVQRLNYTERFDDDQTAVRDIMKSDMENLKETIANLDDEAMAKAVDAVLKARKIYIMGLRSSAPLSAFMHFYMTLLFDDVVHIHSNSTNEVFEQIMPITKEDIMIGISFPRYSQRTINSMEYAKKKGATVLAITDKDNTAMTEHADIKLFAKSSMASFVDSLSAPLSLINALLVTLGIHRREHIRSSFESLEILWSQYEVYNGGKDRADRPKEEETE